MTLKKMIMLVFFLAIGALWLAIQSKWVDLRVFSHPSEQILKATVTTEHGGSAGCGQNPSYPCAYSDESKLVVKKTAHKEF